MPINTKPHIHEYVVCANIFVRKDGKWLLLQRSPKKKYAPNVINPIGGKVDPNENPYEAARREVLEEAGITVKNMRLEAVVLEILPHTGLPYNWLIFQFSADYDAGELKTTEEGEFVLLTSEEVLKNKHRMYRTVQKYIDHIVNPNDGTLFATVMHDDEKDIVTDMRKDFCVK